MQQGRDLTDLCWYFVFISHTVTDKLHNKIPSDCRSCRNDPFCWGEKSTDKRRRGELIFLNFPCEKCLQCILMKEKAFHHSVLQWLAMTQSEGDQCRKSHSAFQSPKEFLYVPFSVWGQRGREGGVRGEHSLISNKLQGWPLPVVSWWALNWGVAMGSHFSWSAVIDSPYSQGHFWQKLNLCLFKQVPERRCYCHVGEDIFISIFTSIFTGNPAAWSKPSLPNAGVILRIRDSERHPEGPVKEQQSQFIWAL